MHVIPSTSDATMFTSTAFSGSDTHAGFTHRSAEPVTAGLSHPVGLSASKAQSAFPLSMAESGMTVRVTALRGSGMDRRMTEMGLNVGADIRVVQHQGGGLVVQRGESRYALGAGLAHRVMVVPV
jgi:ferrous iron transport protein A